MYKICSLAAAALVAACLTLATPAASQAQQFNLSIGSRPGGYYGSYYRPGYSHHHGRGGYSGYSAYSNYGGYGGSGGYCAPRTVIVQPGYQTPQVFVQPAPVFAQPAPVFVQPAPTFVSPYGAQGYGPQRSSYGYPY